MISDKLEGRHLEPDTLYEAGYPTHFYLFLDLIALRYFRLCGVKTLLAGVSLPTSWHILAKCVKPRGGF